MINTLKRIFLIAGDVGILYFSLATALLIRYGSRFSPETWNRHFIPFTILYAIWIGVLWSQNLYEPRVIGNRREFFRSLAGSLAINAALGVGFFYFIPYFAITPKTILFLNLLFFSIFFSVWRYGYNFLTGSSRLRKHLVFIGINKEVGELIHELSENPQLGYRPMAVYTETEGPIPRQLIHLKTRGGLNTYLGQQEIHTICFSQDEDARNLHLYSYIPRGTEFKRVPQLYEEITGRIPLDLIQELWFLENLNRGYVAGYNMLKRGFDMIFASFLLIVILPFWPFIILSIKLGDGGPIFLKQTRVGENGRPLQVLKFRTMIPEAEKHGPLWSRENDPRITRVGRVLRSTLLDETPQLLLVLAGKMSLVGPRPERKEFVENLARQIPHYTIRHMVKPGLTGWAQINFGYGSSVEDAIQKLQYELYYIKNRSLALDLSILFKTVNIIMERALWKKR